MARQLQILKRILKNTGHNISRNKGLSVATVIVIALAFTISCSIAGLVFLSNKTIQSFEKKAQLIMFFKPDSEESEILEIKSQLENSDKIENIEYISQEEALESYLKDFEDNPSLAEYVTSDALPPSLNIRVKSIEYMAEVAETCIDIQENNDTIDEIMYFKDVVDKLEGISNVLEKGGISLVIALSIISSALVLITIGFNIKSHQKEIEVMKLIGSTNSFVKIPYLLEGAFYGFIGSAISISLLFILWYSGLDLLKDNQMFIFISQIFTDIGTPYLKSFSWSFALPIIGSIVGIGSLLGLISSSIATWRYLK